MTDREPDDRPAPTLWPQACQRLIAVAAVLVPLAQRADWLEEWRAEMAWHWSEVASGRRLTWRQRSVLLSRACGAVIHALWLRKQEWSVEMLLQDVRFGLRMLARRPAFALMAALTLAVGIGATTAIFSVVHAVLLKPLPYRQPDRLVQIWETNPLRDWTEANVAPANLLDWKQRNRVFEDMAFYFGSDTREPGFTNQTLAGPGDAEHLRSLRVSTNFFTVLGVVPAIGRSFTAAEAIPGNHRVIVLSDALWRGRFAADPSIVGRRVRLGAFDYQVAGVMPPTFRYGAGTVDFWQPLAFQPDDFRAMRKPHMLRVVARLKAGVTMARARAEMSAIAAALEREYPDTNTQMGVGLGPLDDWFVGNVRMPLLVFLGAVGFLLLIACSNVANLMLAHALGRRHEIAVRSALGAGRLRLVQQLLTESLLLSLAGGGLGLVFSAWGIGAFVALSPADLPRVEEIRTDVSVLLFSALLTCATAFLFGLVPALHAAGTSRTETLAAGSRGGTMRGRGTRRLLVASEVALAFVLVVGAGLTMRSLVRLRNVSPGIEVTHLLTARITLHSGYDDDTKAIAFFEDAVARVRAIPGIRSAGAASRLALQGYTWTGDLAIEGRPDVWGRELRHKTVVPGYFRAVGLPLLAGRDFSQFDDEKAPRVAVINHTLAGRFFHREDPVGRRISYTKPGQPPKWVTVVGVVADEKQDGLAAPTKPEVYEPQRQAPADDLTIVARTDVDSASMVPLLRDAIRSIDPTVALYDIETMERRIEASVAPQRLDVWLLTFFGVVALLLAAVGVYGVVAFSVRSRLREIGIRVALGAHGRDVVRLGLADGIVPAMAGLGVGLILALAFGRWLSALLFDTAANDAATLVSVAGLLMAVALLASYLPARRAMRVDPIAILRAE